MDEFLIQLYITYTKFPFIADTDAFHMTGCQVESMIIEHLIRLTLPVSHAMSLSTFWGTPI